MKFVKNFLKCAVLALLLASLLLASCGRGDDAVSSETGDGTLKLIPFGANTTSRRKYLSADGPSFHKSAVEIDPTNPWREGIMLDTMPVLQIGRGDGEKLKADLEETASVFGVDVTEGPVLFDVPYPYSQLEGNVDGASATIQGEVGRTTMFLKYEINEGEPLEGAFLFDTKSYDAALKAVSDFTFNYGYRLLGSGNFNGFVESNAVSGTGYNGVIYKGDKSEDERQCLLNSRLNKITWSISDLRSVGSVLVTIDIYKGDELEIYGNYPIISEEEAEKLLLDGKCYTSSEIWVPFEIDKDAIKKVVLTYNSNPPLERYDTMFMPFYCFWLELPGEDESSELADELTTYWPLYVPAIDESFLIMGGSLKTIG